MEITDKELALAKKVAYNTSRKWSDIETEELEAELYLWLCENYKYVERYRTEDHGQAKLRTALSRYATQHCVKEQERINGQKMKDKWAIISKEQLKTALPYVWEQLPTMSAQVHPATGAPIHKDTTEQLDEAVAVLIDIRQHITRLSDRQQLLLQLRYYYGYTPQEIADKLNITKHQAWKRGSEALDKLYILLSETNYRNNTKAC